MFNAIETAIWVGLMRIKSKFCELFTKEDGAVDIVAIVVMIGIAVLVAVVFRKQISTLIEGLFSTITQTADNAVLGND